MKPSAMLDSRLPLVFAAALAFALLAATLVWHVPFMLWDHLDLAPIYAGWQDGELFKTGFLKIHGGHLHTAAYVVLLATTWLTHGHPWLDCLVSWILLVGYAVVVLRLFARTVEWRDRAVLPAAMTMVFLVLYPGHLANLQWGWQVAVFLCLFGVAVAIAALSAPRLTWKHDAIAMCATLLALLSFATALAMIPVVMLILLLRTDLRWKDRLLFALPWLTAGLAAVYVERNAVTTLTQFSLDRVLMLFERYPPLGIMHYVFNFLGGGIARFVPDAAPWLAALGLVIASMAFVQIRDRQRALPWLGFLLFAVIGAVLTALARFRDAGADQAFVARYVSFSSMFWIGLVGLIALAAAERCRHRWWPISGWMVAMLAVINAAQLVGEAAQIGADTRVQAALLCAKYPHVVDSALQNMHYAGAQAARERLEVVYRLGFAPSTAAFRSVRVNDSQCRV